jgi:branched-chain amino acid transport system ATP-binding protein
MKGQVAMEAMAQGVSSTMPILQARRLCKAFGGLKAVDELSFSLARGELLALIGPNGAGKTTCFHLLHGHLTPDQGSILLRGQDITKADSIRRASLGMARTFQVTAIYPALRVIDHLLFAERCMSFRGLDWLEPVSIKNSSLALDWLKRLHLDALAERFAHELSYGDLKRLELAMVLAQRPALLLMDEPTAGLPPAERQDLMRLVETLTRQEQLAVLLTEHAMDVVFGFADRLMVMHRGRLIAQGSAEVIAKDPEVRQAYLGSLNLEAILSSRHQHRVVDEKSATSASH